MRWAFDRGGGAANLDNKELTVSKRKWELSQLDDATLPDRVERAKRLNADAISAARSGQSPGWWLSRERGEAIPDTQRMADCGKNVTRLLNTETGEIIEQIQGCNHPLCPGCAKRRAGKLSRKLSQSIAQLENELRAQELIEKRRHRRPYLITLTVRHSGSISTDIARLALAWTRFRASWWASLKQRFAYVRFLEVASKSSTGGHAHWHMLAWWPPADWSRLQRWWRKAVKRADTKLGVKWDCDKKRNNAGNIQVSEAQHAAAAYCAKARKYASKSAVDVGGMAIDAVAAMIAKLKTARRVSASVGFWGPKQFFTVWTVLDAADASTLRPGPGWWRAAAPSQGPPARPS